MNKEVNFEISKLLKEKGFDELCNNHYSQALFEGTNPDWEGVFPKYSVFKHSDSHYNSKPNNNDSWFECSAPTIAEVVMWLYEKHGIWISVQKDWDDSICLGWEAKIDFSDGVRITETVNSIREAYDFAIKYVLKNLI